MNINLKYAFILQITDFFIGARSLTQMLRYLLTLSLNCNCILSPSALFNFSQKDWNPHMWLGQLYQGLAQKAGRPALISSRLPNNLLLLTIWSQFIQLIRVFISLKLQLAGYLVEIIIPRYLGLVCKISCYLAKYPAICPVRHHQPEDSQCARMLSKISWANFLSLCFKLRGKVSSWRDL